MSIMIEITRKVPIGSVLKTPSGRSQFTMYHIDADRVLIRIGKKGNILSIPAPCLEGAPNFLRGKGWIRMGAIHDTSYEGTFDCYVKKSTHGTSAASYIAPLLEKAAIVEIDRIHPAKIRLRASK